MKLQELIIVLQTIKNHKVAGHITDEEAKKQAVEVMKKAIEKWEKNWRATRRA